MKDEELLARRRELEGGRVGVLDRFEGGKRGGKSCVEGRRTSEVELETRLEMASGDGLSSFAERASCARLELFKEKRRHYKCPN